MDEREPEIQAGEPQTFIEHLGELRQRLIYSLLAIALMFAISWFFRHDILYLLKKPLVDALPEAVRYTILLRVMDKFVVHLKLAFYGALFLASPAVLYQAWMFIAPGLYRNERRFVFPFLLAATVLFFGGVAFCYFAVMPFGFKFFVEYSLSGGDGGLSALLLSGEGQGDMLQISLKEHIDFTARFLLAFGLAFESPLFMVALSAMRIVSPQQFAKWRPLAVVGIFVFAAVLTPPDPWTQLSLGIPLMLLYEAGILVGRLIYAMRGESQSEEEEQEDEEQEDEIPKETR